MNNITIKKYTNSAIAIIVMIGFGYLPVLDPITPLGMKILGIFLGCIYGWLTVDVFWPSILGLVLLGHTGYMPVSQVFASAFSNTTLLLMLFMMMLGGLISASGVADVLTLKLLSTRGLQGKPWIIAFVLFVASFLISALCGGAVAAVAICWVLLYKISAQVGYKPGDAYPMLVASGIVFIGSCGNHVLPFQGSVVMCMGFSPVSIEYSAPFTIFSLIFTVIMIAIYIVILKYIIKPDVTPMTKEFRLDESTIFTGEQKIVLGIVTVLFLLLLIPSYLPATNGFRIFIKGIGDHVLTLLALALASFVIYKNKSVSNVQTMMHEGVAWNVFFMVMAAFTLATALTSKDTGVIPFINATISPLFVGKSEFFFVAISLIIAAFATNVINNAVVASLIVPVCTTIAIEMSLNPAIIATLLTYACMVGVALPTGSPVGAMMFGNKEWIPGNNALKLGVGSVVFHTLLLIIIGYPLAILVY